MMTLVNGTFKKKGVKMRRNRVTNVAHCNRQPRHAASFLEDVAIPDEGKGIRKVADSNQNWRYVGVGDLAFGGDSASRVQ